MNKHADRDFRYLVYREGEHFVSQCLNVDVSSFGGTEQEAVDNLREALDLYFEDRVQDDYQEVGETHLGVLKLSV